MKNATSLRKQQDVCAVPCFAQDKVNAVRASLAQEEERLPELADFYRLLGNTTRLKILLALEKDLDRFALCLKRQERPPRNALVLVGPEGGFTAEETALLVDAGTIPASLGKGILRVETAALRRQQFSVHSGRDPGSPVPAIPSFLQKETALQIHGEGICGLVRHRSAPTPRAITPLPGAAGGILAPGRWETWPVTRSTWPSWAWI